MVDVIVEMDVTVELPPVVLFVVVDVVVVVDAGVVIIPLVRVVTVVAAFEEVLENVTALLMMLRVVVAPTVTAVYVVDDPSVTELVCALLVDVIVSLQNVP